MEFRVENKYLVSDGDLALLSKRLSAVMTPDAHQVGSAYEIRSVYFDDARNRCMDENEEGLDQRQKYRIRTYAPSMTPIRLEIKAKERGLTQKTSCRLSEAECRGLLDGTMRPQWGDRPPLNRLFLQMGCEDMRPKVLIAYERTAFVHPCGNVRITFDRNIAASGSWDGFLSPRMDGLIPVLPTGMQVLEVKYDEFLPDFLARQLELGNLQQIAFSKYYLGRLALNGEFPIL